MDKSKNQALMVKIICVLLSFALWLYITNVENPTRTYEVKKIPVTLMNLDAVENSQLSMIDNQNFTIDLKIEGAWGDVNKVKASDFDLVADMSSYALKEGENVIPVQIISYPQNITLKNSSILAIKVNLESITTKQLTIKSKVDIDYKQNIHEVNQIIDPKTVEITGGSSVVNSIEDAVIKGEMNDVGENTSKSYSIVFLDKHGNEVENVKANIDSAKLSVTVTNGKSVPVNLVMTGTLPDGYELESYDLSNKMIGIVGNSSALSSTSRIDTEDVDVSSITGDSEITANLKIPNGITIQNGEKYVKVKFKIKKKEDADSNNSTSNSAENEKATKNITCAVRYESLSDAFSMEASNNQVNVSLSGNKEDIEKITKDNISVIVDLSKINKEGEYNLVPKASFLNGENLTIVNVDSVSVTIKNKE